MTAAIPTVNIFKGRGIHCQVKEGYPEVLFRLIQSKVNLESIAVAPFKYYDL